MSLVALLGCGIIPTPTATPLPMSSPTAVAATATPIAGLGFDIHFIDVAQGDATLIVANTGESMLVDGGRSRARIRERLEAMGVTDLDAIAMTHPDADHAAGLIEVLEMYDIERIYLNGSDASTQTFANLMEGVQAEGAEVVTITRGDVINLGGLELTVLHPGTSLSGDPNRDSMVLLLDCGEVEVLLPGDADVHSELEMISAGVLFDIDVLKLGHHGSRTSTSDEFLDILRPEAGLISAGLGNQFGHPHQDVLDLLADTGVASYLTDTTEGVDTVRMTSDCQTYSFN